MFSEVVHKKKIVYNSMSGEYDARAIKCCEGQEGTEHL